MLRRKVLGLCGQKKFCDGLRKKSLERRRPSVEFLLECTLVYTYRTGWTRICLVATAGIYSMSWVKTEQR
jgi:hypothetical protein